MVFETSRSFMIKCQNYSKVHAFLRYCICRRSRNFTVAESKAFFLERGTFLVKFEKNLN